MIFQLKTFVNKLERCLENLFVLNRKAFTHEHLAHSNYPNLYTTHIMLYCTGITLVSFIQKNVSQLFRREENIKNLPPIYGRTRRPKPKPLLGEGSAEIGLCALFAPEEDVPSTSAM